MRLRLLLLILALGLLPGCARRYGKCVMFDNARVVFNRDKSKVALGFEFVHYPESNWSPAVEHGYEIQTFDLAHRERPRRVLRWTIGEREEVDLAGWDSLGIIVAREPPGKFEVYRVNPSSGDARRLARVSAREFTDWSARLNDHEPRETHLDSGADGYYLWNQDTRKKEFLFALPAIHEGYPNPFLSTLEERAAQERFGDSLHRIWHASTEPAGDHHRVTVQTYVPRPVGIWVPVPGR